MDMGKSDKHISALQNQTVQFGDKMYELFIQASESRLLEMADAARNNEDQWKLLQLSRELRKQKATLLTTFRSGLINGFHLFRKDQLGGKDTTKQDMAIDLSLVADDELEQDLAISSLARRAETRFSEELFGLMQRLAVLKGGKKLPEDGSPLGASQFAIALQTALHTLELDTRFTVMFFRVFEKVLLENLGDFYKSANDYLKQQGILPNLRFGVGINRAQSRNAEIKKDVLATEADSAATPEQSTSTTPAVASPAQPITTPPDPARVALANRVEQEILENPAFQQTMTAQRQLYESISGLQSGQAAASAAQNSIPPSGGGATTGSQVLPFSGNFRPDFFSQPAFSTQGNTAAAVCTRSDVVTALAQVPMDYHAEVMDHIAVPPPMTVEQYQNVTRQISESLGDDKQLAEDDGRVIDLVGMIFEYMLGDKQLPDAVKAVLSYLHTPYLKAAFIDRSLFEKPEHSSRQLLNCLAEAGTRWVNADGASQFKVFPKIKSVVRRVLMEFHHDTSLFGELLLEMREFNQKVERSIEVVERRAREKAEGEERLRDVKRRVLREVRQRMDAYELPAHIVVLLLHPWLDYLTFILLRYGDDSSQWHEGVDTVGEVIWSVQEKTDIVERNRLILIQESLLQRVQTGLETIAHDQAKSNRLLELLSKSQMLVLENLVVEPAAPAQRAELEAEVSEELLDVVVDDSQLTADEKSVLNTLNQAPVGTWLEFDQLNDNKQVRAKIAWSNARTSHFMLVDRGGKQLALKKGLEIAHMILASEARILVESGKPFFERALEGILLRLKAIVAH